MAISFPGDFYLRGVNVRPRTQFELDQIVRSWKCGSATEEDVLSATGLPQVGDAHPLFPFMFVTGLNTSETGDSACSLDVTYQGCLYTIEAGPVLPAKKHSSSGPVASATTNTSSAIFPLTATNPATVQFYGFTNTISFYSNDPDDATEPDDPSEITELITWDLGFGLQPGLSMPALVTFLLTEAFVQGIIETPPEVEEVVAGNFYRITKTKSRTLFPYAPAS